MAEKIYTYSKASDFGGVFNSDRFTLEVEASSIERKLSRIGAVGDVVQVVFKGANDLSVADETTLQGASYPSPVGGLVAAHDGSPVDVDPTLVRQIFHVDDHRAQVDGHTLEAVADEWKWNDYSIPYDLHLNESLVYFDGFFPGDYAFPCVINPAGDGGLGQAESAGATTIHLATGKAAYYNPALGAQHIEFWDAGKNNLLEVHSILSADAGPDTVEIPSPGLVGAMAADVEVRVRYGSFCPVRGQKGIEGGLHGIGQDRFSLRQPYSMTDILPAGTIISARMKTTSDVGTRKLACTYIFRTP
jgi:hypothetical protein